MTPYSKEDYNEDELEAPTWLDKAFFTKVLSKSEPNGKPIEIKSFKISPATVKGDHYASVMFRAAIEYTIDNIDKIKSIIIKTIPEAEGIKKDFLERLDTFEIEIGMYTEVLPLFEKYLRDVGDDTKLMARVLYHELSPHKLIIFEDLVTLDYKVLRGRQPNLEEAEAAYAKLAKWHAVSYKLVKEQPHLFDKYRTSLFTEENSKNNPFMLNCVTMFMEMLQKTQSMQKYLPRFQTLTQNVDLLAEVFKIIGEYRGSQREHALYVLNHSDFHVNNLMFKYDAASEKLEDVMLLDFQFCSVGSMACDLIYSLYTFLGTEQRSSAGHFLRYYFNVFRETLEKISCDGSIPSYNQYEEELKSNKYLAIFLMMFSLPMWPKFCRGEITIDLLVTDLECARKLFEDREYIEELLVLIPKYIKLGYLDV